MPLRSETEGIQGPVRDGSRRGPWAYGNGSIGKPLTRWTHGEGSWWSHVHVNLWGKFQCSELFNLLLQPPVFLRQILTAPFQEFAVHLRLLQLRPEIPIHQQFYFFPFLLKKSTKI